MQTPETSDASVTRLGQEQPQIDLHQMRETTKMSACRTVSRSLSPITLAVAITATVAAAFFVAYDMVRSLDETTVTMDFPAVIINPDSVWNSILQRSATAFALAGLATFLVSRRRKEGMPDNAQRDHYRTFAAAIPMGFACWTDSGKLITCNDQYYALLALPHHISTYADVIKPVTQGGSIKLLREDERSRAVEWHRQDGTCLLIDERPLDDGTFMSLVSDITEARRTNRLLQAIRHEQRHLTRRYHEAKLKAEAASRSKSSFLAHLSHDIRTPLNHIIGFADLMRHQPYGPLGDKRYTEYVQSIKSSGESLLTSLANILDLAELEGGRKPLRTDPVMIDEILNTVLQRFKAQASRAGIALTIGERSHTIVEGDTLGLTRMLTNILENALRFTPAGGQVHLAAHAAQDGVVIEVSDTGIGMSEEHLAGLLHPFTPGDASLTRAGPGSGLGIATARAIAEQSGGDLAIDSSPALGTTVAISLPLASTACSQQAA